MDITPIELAAYQRLAETGLTPAELLSMDMDAYARVTGRPTAGQVAAQAFENSVPGTPRQEPAPAPQSAPQPPAPEPQGVDIASTDWATYAQFRQEAGIGGREYGRGALDGGSTQDWIAAAQKQAGRHAWQGQNVAEAPKLENRTVLKQDTQLDTRPASARFSNQANFWNGGR